MGPGVYLSIDAVESATCFFMSLTLLAGLLAEYFIGLWWADYLATALIVSFVAKEAVESFREVGGENVTSHGVDKVHMVGNITA